MEAANKQIFLFQKRDGILQSRQIQEEITGNTEYVVSITVIFKIQLSAGI